MDNAWMCLHPDPSLRRGLESLGPLLQLFSTNLTLQLPLCLGQPPTPWTPEDVNDNICSHIYLSSGEDVGKATLETACSFPRYTEEYTLCIWRTPVTLTEELLARQRNLSSHSSQVRTQAAPSPPSSVQCCLSSDLHNIRLKGKTSKEVWIPHLKDHSLK